MPQPEWSDYLGSRSRWALASLVLGLLLPLWGEPLDDPSPAALRRALARAAQCVEASAYVPSPRGSRLVEWVLGRHLTFVAVDSSGQSDAFTARVRVGWDGTPVQVHSAHNLTRTPLASESHLRAFPDFTVYATLQGEKVSSLTFMRDEESRWQRSWSERLQLLLDRPLSRASLMPPEQTDLFLSEPTASLSFEVQSGAAQLTVDHGEIRFPVAQLFSSSAAGHVERTSTGLAYAIATRTSSAKPWVHFFADEARAWVGTEAVAFLEATWFRLKRLASPDGVPPPERPRKEPQGAAEEGPPAFPPELPPQISRASLRSQGFEPWGSDLWPVGNDGPLLARLSFVPEGNPESSEVVVVAVDTRRLDLTLRAGYEDPHPETGPPGTGHIPPAREQFSRLVATFNGGFKSVHGREGFIAEGRMMVPPIPGRATILSDETHRVGLGTLTETTEGLSTKRLAERSGGISLRQNLTPLLDGLKDNPERRESWGEHLMGRGVATERSALCARKDGHLFYVWSKEIAAEGLIAALRLLDCEYAVHLDMNPGHCSFALHKVASFDPLKSESRLLDARMEVSPERHLRWSPQDFFALSLRSGSPDGSPFSYESVQHPQMLVPYGKLRTILGNLEVRILRLPIDAIAWSVRVGSGDRGGEAETSAPLEDFVLGLGHRTQGSRPGLSRGTEQSSPMNRSEASLVIGPNSLHLLEPGEAIEPSAGTSIVQLPSAARSGKLTPLARQIGDTRLRAALCLAADGHVLVSEARSDSSIFITQALVDQGCQHVVLLDRGSHHPARVETGSGSGGPLKDTGEETLLLGAARKNRLRAYVLGQP